MDIERIEAMKTEINKQKEILYALWEPRNQYIYELYKAGHTVPELAEAFGMKEQSVGRVIKYREPEIEPVEELRLVY